MEEGFTCVKDPSVQSRTITWMIFCSGKDPSLNVRAYHHQTRYMVFYLLAKRVHNRPLTDLERLFLSAYREAIITPGRFEKRVMFVETWKTSDDLLPYIGSALAKLFNRYIKCLNYELLAEIKARREEGTDTNDAASSVRVQELQAYVNFTRGTPWLTGVADTDKVEYKEPLYAKVPTLPGNQIKRRVHLGHRLSTEDFVFTSKSVTMENLQHPVAAMESLSVNDLVASSDNVCNRDNVDNQDPSEETMQASEESDDQEVTDEMLRTWDELDKQEVAQNTLHDAEQEVEKPAKERCPSVTQRGKATKTRAARDVFQQRKTASSGYDNDYQMTVDNGNEGDDEEDALEIVSGSSTPVISKSWDEIPSIVQGHVDGSPVSLNKTAGILEDSRTLLDACATPASTSLHPGVHGEYEEDEGEDEEEEREEDEAAANNAPTPYATPEHEAEVVSPSESTESEEE